MNREDTRRNWGTFSLVGLAIAGVAYTGGTLMASPRAPAFAGPGAQSASMRIQVSGAVQKPGVYSFSQGQRVEDALAAAGGPSAGARLAELNLAAKLVDAVPLFIPSQDDDSTGGPYAINATGVGSAPLGIMSSPPPSGNSNPSGGAGGISINTASASELEEIPGVGPAIASRIIDYRTRNGGFKSVDELDAVSGIGPRTLEKLRPFVRL